MFLASQGLLTLEGITTRTHRGVLSNSISQKYDIGKEYLSMFVHSMQTRSISDYGVETKITKEEVEDILNEAEQFVNKIEEVIKNIINLKQ